MGERRTYLDGIEVILLGEQAQKMVGVNLWKRLCETWWSSGV